MENNFSRDILGNELNAGDWVAYSYYHGDGSLYTGQISRITSKTVYIGEKYYSRQCHYPKSQLLKLTEEQSNKIKK